MRNILNSDVKSVFTAGAYNGVLALFFGKSEIVATSGATLVNMGFSVAESALNQIKILFRFFHKIKVCGVFFLPFVNIS